MEKIQIQEEKYFTRKFIRENSNLIDQGHCKTETLLLLRSIFRFGNRLKKLNKQSDLTNNIAAEKQFKNFLDGFFKTLEKHEISIKDKKLIARLKSAFRTLVLEFMNQSIFVKHGYTKPKGYPGDFQIIEAMYNNVPLSKHVGFLLDKYFLNSDYVKAVRNRKDIMKYYLKNFLERCSRPPIKILNLGCGSSREIRELLQENTRSFTAVEAILLDQEIAALDFSKREIESTGTHWKFQFIQDNVLNFLGSQSYIYDTFGVQNLIYSIGLADYLPDSVLGPLLRTSFNALRDDGELIIAHKNISEFRSFISDWGADWNFIPRTCKEVAQLFHRFLQGKKYFLYTLFAEKKRVFFTIASLNKIYKKNFSMCA